MFFKCYSDLIVSSNEDNHLGSYIFSIFQFREVAGQVKNWTLKECIDYAVAHNTSLILKAINQLIIKVMIKTNELIKVFRTEEVETLALNRITLNVSEGEYVAIMGPSGCGKTTLLNILGLLDNPTSGSYVFNGTEVANLKERDRTFFRKGNIGFVFQSFNLIDDLNVFENVELPLLYLKMKTSERKKKVGEALERMKIMHRGKHFPRLLSGGEQQRAAIARAVVSNPRLILADEPTGNLDSTNGIEVMNLLTELNNEGTTIIMVTHSDRDAGYAHRIVNLFDGKIVEE
jgi:putative ABC transport system ATP-binding protein